MPKHLREIYDIVKHQMDQQSLVTENLSSRATYLLSSVVIFLGLVWNFEFSDDVTCLMTMALVLFAMSTLLLLYVLHPRSYSNVPEPNAVIALRKRGKDLDHVLGHTIGKIGVGYRHNAKILRKRGEALQVAFWTVYMAVLLVGVAWIAT